MVVVDPHEVARTPLRRDEVGEPRVRVDVGPPVPGLEREPIGHVVEHRPQHAVREALVVPVDLARGQVDRHQAGGGELPVEGPALGGIEPRHVARPADPQPAGLGVRPAEPDREAAGARDQRHLPCARGGRSPAAGSRPAGPGPSHRPCPDPPFPRVQELADGHRGVDQRRRACTPAGSCRAARRSPGRRPPRTGRAGSRGPTTRSNTATASSSRPASASASAHQNEQIVNALVVSPKSSSLPVAQHQPVAHQRSLVGVERRQEPRIAGRRARPIVGRSRFEASGCSPSSAWVKNPSSRVVAALEEQLARSSSAIAVPARGVARRAPRRAAIRAPAVIAAQHIAREKV